MAAIKKAQYCRGTIRKLDIFYTTDYLLRNCSCIELEESPVIKLSRKLKSGSGRSRTLVSLFGLPLQLNMESGQPGSLYVYAPNRAAPVFFAVAFGLSAIGHVWQCIKYKSFKLVGLHPLCAILFTAGYALREYGSFNYLYSDRNLILYILSQVFIFICPPLLELANYHVLGRVLYYVPYFAPMPPGRVLATFGGLMALVEALNAVGVALSSNPSADTDQQKMGSNLTIAALVIQLVVIVIFVMLAGVFHLRCKKADLHVKVVFTTLVVLYVSMALILARCIYRLVEHAGNTTVDITDLTHLEALSPILRYEVYFYIFEASLMLINSVIWNIWHPGRSLPSSSNVHLSSDGETEITDTEDVDDRSLLAKIACILTFGIMFRKRTKKRSFQELDDFQAVRR
ncbi:hypothetical protein QQS21_000056 [Conoideocrella luteorostrata]|uniref:RTA1 domain protein n=1 Tax=Conoideocrella luteorostrata TaxID=1105319 RepID=A0AAJ0CZL4_9HYPO|nr:hypothetical protein QQS21_000056 [Conoideocrella luteorostrata]